MPEIQKVQFTRLKNLFLTLFCNDFVGRVVGLVYRDIVPSHGIKVDTQTNVDNLVKAYLFWGVYEGAEVKFIRKYLLTNFDVIELGSSLGVVSCLISRLISNSARLICVEANLLMLNKISRNLYLNQINKNISIVHGAISNSDESSINFYIGENNLVSGLKKSESALAIEKVPTLTLEKLLDEHCIDKYTLVCDIEGAELNFIINNQSSLKHCQQMIIELHNSEIYDEKITVDEIAKIIVTDHNFNLRARRGSVFVFEK